MKLVKGTSTYTFPTYSALTGVDASVRDDSDDKAFGHGSFLTGDGLIKERSLEVEILLETTTRAGYTAAINALKAAAYRQNQRLYIDDTRFFNVRCLSKISEEFHDGFYLVSGTVTLTFLATDPFIYNGETVTKTVAVSASPASITVTNNGTVDTPVKIIITPTAVNASMSLVNMTDGNRTFGYTDAAFSAGKVLVVDSSVGTVKKDGTSTINNMGGTFLNLLPGDNVITYTGAVGTIAFEYAERWL